LDPRKYDEARVVHDVAKIALALFAIPANPTIPGSHSPRCTSERKSAIGSPATVTKYLNHSSIRLWPANWRRFWHRSKRGQQLVEPPFGRARHLQNEQ
jgi:hypothetical protein